MERLTKRDFSGRVMLRDGMGWDAVRKLADYEDAEEEGRLLMLDEPPKRCMYVNLEEIRKFPIRIDNYDKVNGSEVFVLGIESVMEYIESLPTVETIDVVRCGGCVNEQTCPLAQRLGENGYCSEGERK